MIHRAEYADVFRLKKRVIARVRQLIRPLLLDTGNDDKEYAFPRPLKIRNLLGGWNAENETTVFLVKTVGYNSVTICNAEDFSEQKFVPWKAIPLEDLIRIQNLIENRIAKQQDKKIKLPTVQLLDAGTYNNIADQSLITDGPSGVAGKRIMTIGVWKVVGFFWFKRDDVRLCNEHAAPFQPLQPSLRSRTFGDIPARCPWCPWWRVTPVLGQVSQHCCETVADDTAKQTVARSGQKEEGLMSRRRPRPTQQYLNSRRSPHRKTSGRRPLVPLTAENFGRLLDANAKDLKSALDVLDEIFGPTRATRKLRRKLQHEQSQTTQEDQSQTRSI